MSIFRAQWARKHETKQIARHPFRRTLMIVYTVCIGFWRSWNLRLFLVRHKKCFLHLRGLQQSSCIYRASPKNISWNLWCLEQLFWKINNNILESYWTHRFPTLYQTTILGTRWDLEDTRVINIKSCQANYLPISTMPLINQMIAWISNGNFCFFHGSLGNSAKVLS